jgi:hypothetical protein
MSLSTFYNKYRRWNPIASFLLGFAFDAYMLERIDELKVIIQQAIYLGVAGFLIGVELVEHAKEFDPPRWLAKFWKYREALLHFMLGTLLNSYTIFYFKSASTITSFLFIAILIAILTANEFFRFGKSQTQVHVAFLSLCLISFLVSLSPIVLGYIGTVPFLCAVLFSGLLSYGYWRVLKAKLAQKPALLKTHLLYPFVGIQFAFVSLYILRAIPPVPLSVKYMGIYHGVEKAQGEYELTYTRPRWKFWQNGDQTFVARPGDIIHCYTQIFSPTRFKDQLRIRWLYYDKKLGWHSSDAIPMPILGGRDEGYRAVTKKANFQPGDWRVQVETDDGREVGRIGFSVVTDDSTDERELRKEKR